MANGTNQPTGGVYVGIAILVAAPFLASPFYVASLASADRKVARELDPSVDQVIATLHQLDESLLQVSDLRQRLSAAGADLTAGASARAAEAKPELLESIDADLRAGKTFPADKILEASERRSRALTGAAAGTPHVPGLGGHGASYAQKSFNELTALLKANDGLIQSAERTAKVALGVPGTADVSGANNLWANRAAALVALAKGRMWRDRAWLDRWQVVVLRGAAHEQALQASALRRMAESCAGRTPADAIEQATKRQSELQKQSSDLREEVTRRNAAVKDRKSRIDRLLADVRTTRDALMQMDLKPFKPADPLKAGEQFKSYSQQYERLSAAARQAESQAESLRSGALIGGELAPDADGDLLVGEYQGAKPAEGLVSMQAALAELEQRAAAVEADLAGTKDALAKLNDTAQMQDTQKASLNAAADAQAAEARKAMQAVAKLLASAANSEKAAVDALDGGARYTQAAQSAAKNRVKLANEKKLEVNAEKTAERLEQVITDRDTEASTLTLAADLAWAAAETYAQAIADELAQQTFLTMQNALLGGAGPDETAAPLDAWRKSAQNKLTLAAQRLKEAKTLISAAVFQGPDNTRISGANYKWQVSQLEAAVFMLSAQLADSADSAKEALDKARAALQETVTNRENSPLLATAVAALKSIP